MRVAPKSRKRVGDHKHAVIDGVIVCKVCADPLESRFRYGQLRCGSCREYHSYCMTILSGKAAAYRLVAIERREGRLPPASNYMCVCCGLRPAEQYDHRDYGKPLELDPVCRSCNIMRGAALPVIPAPLFGLQA